MISWRGWLAFLKMFLFIWGSLISNELWEDRRAERIERVRILSFIFQSLFLSFLPLPALSCEAKEKIRLCFTLSLESNLAKTRIWGRQFFVCGGPSSKRSRLNLAADKANPRRPSPHSFSALLTKKINNIIKKNWKTINICGGILHYIALLRFPFLEHCPLEVFEV